MCQENGGSRWGLLGWEEGGARWVVLSGLVLGVHTAVWGAAKA